MMEKSSCLIFNPLESAKGIKYYYYRNRKTALKIHRKKDAKITGKEADPETGLYYYGARYLDPRTSRWMSGDPAVGDYVPSAPVSDEARKRNSSLPGMGGVYNLVNLHVYHYAGNNPVRYVDPDGEKQNLAQRAFSAALSAVAKNETIGSFVRDHTSVSTTRNYYQGNEIGTGTYYQDKTSVKFFGIPLNSIQTQTTVDHSGYSASEALSDNTTYNAIIGQSGATNELIRDTILIDGDNFLHRPKADNSKPGSGGCVIPPTAGDVDEVNEIVTGVGFKKDDDIKWTFTKPYAGTPKANNVE
jgi:RHS repeat-associated protein